MRILIQKIGLFVACSALLVFAAFSAHKSAQANYAIGVSEAPAEAPHYTVSASSAIKKSRQSAVRVMSVSPDGEYISSASGTYIKYKGLYYILTVSHGLAGECEDTKIIVGAGLYDCVRYAAVDYFKDYAIIEVGPIDGRRAINIPRDIPRDRRWGAHTSIMRNTFYTGYPNGLGPLTFDGTIVGYEGEHYVYIQSFAWSGSSGSGVFNDSGKLIGYILAISVGVSEYGFDVLEDIVIVVPLLNVDWSHLEVQGEQ